MRFLLGFASFLLSACGPSLYDAARPGRLTGALVVVWVGEGAAGAGDGRFVFVVPPANPLTFTRPNGRVIRPGMIYTDGGSIPRPVQPLRGFSPWGYAPAYLIHDWLFVARKCVNDRDALPHEAEVVADMPFRDSALILAEVIRTLIAERRVAADDVAPAAITWAVTSPQSQALWRQTGACAAARISADHLDQIEKALPGTTGLRGLKSARATPATIVAQFAF